MHRRRPMAAARLWPLAALVAAALPCVAPAQPVPAAGPPDLAIDRWLVTRAPYPDTVADPLSRDFLGGAESEVLPQRGAGPGSSTWDLLRRDSAALLSLDSLLDPRPPRVVAYAHAYIRSPEDRSVRLRITGPTCGAIGARLNGQPLAEAPRNGEALEVRLGTGWNTLLLEMVTGECPLEFGAVLLPGRHRIDGLRARASRPPGDARSLPEPWVEVPTTLAVQPPLTWRGDALLGDLALPLAAWGPGVVDSAQLRLRVGSSDERASAAGLQPARVARLALRLPFRDLRRGALEPGGARLELRWGTRKREVASTIAAEALLRAVHAPIRLEGWGGEGALPTGDAPLPEAGSPRGGTWRVPSELAGFTLLLEPADAPGAYRIGSGEARATGPLRLCAPCRAGQTITIHAVPSERWEGYPSASVAGEGYPAAAPEPGAPSAEERLRALGADGNREYLRLSGARASAGGGSP